MNLRKEFEKETGSYSVSASNDGTIIEVSDSYLKWLESHLTASRKREAELVGALEECFNQIDEYFGDKGVIPHIKEKNKAWVMAKTALRSAENPIKIPFTKTLMSLTEPTMMQWSKPKEIKMDDRTSVAWSVLHALLVNPERYKYIASLVDSGKITQEEANEKNVSKAFKIADTFLKYAEQTKGGGDEI